MAACSGLSLLALCLALCASLIQQTQGLATPVTSRGAASNLLPRYDFGQDRMSLFKRQAGSYPVTGPLGGTGINGAAPARPELRKLEQNAEAWTLYLLGLDIMQGTNQSDPLSWYQISGIHGRPYLPWDNVQATDGMDQSGYCSHVSTLFPPWHRPYLALFEQVLYNHIQEIAALYPAGADRERYDDAAINFRMPYWDWAVAPPAGQSVLPDSVGGSPGVTVNGPAGIQTIQNPLFSYVFHPVNPDELPDFPFSQWPQTLRHPTNFSDPNATSQNDLVAQQLDSSASSFRDRLYNLFTNYKVYSTFSNEAYIPSNNTQGFDSLESVHDQIHGLTGVGGHMTFIPYSAFDPIFFLHHTMVDRIFAMWQILNPDVYVTPQRTTFGTYTIPYGSIEDVNTPLTPFHSDTAGNFWTCATCRTPETFSYTYKETATSPNEPQGLVQLRTISAINTLYGSGVVRTQPSTARRGIATGGSHTEYITNIRVPKHALGEPFFIHIFLGPDPIPTNPASWPIASNLVGTHCIFTSLHPTFNSSSSSSSPYSDQLVSATIPLTSSLTALASSNHSILPSLSPITVLPFLKHHLRYRVSLIDGSSVANLNVPDLRVSVVSALVQEPADDTAFPVWGTLKEVLLVDPQL